MHAVPRATAPPPPELQPYQSQVFVFSTSMANQAAEAYLVGHTPSIISFHKNQPLTQSFIQSCLNKCEQPYPPSWQQASSPATNQPAKTNKRKGSKQQQQQQKFFTQCPCCVPTRYGPYTPQPPPRMPLRPEMSLPIGARMKNENLTYQQRQHREERLATITQMQQLLFPEQSGPRTYHQQTGGYWNSERPPAPYMFMSSQDQAIPPRPPAPNEPFTLGESLGPNLDNLEQDNYLNNRSDQFTFPPVDELVENIGPSMEGSVSYPSIEQLAVEIPQSSNPIPTDIITPSEAKASLTPDGHSPASNHPPPVDKSEENQDSAVPSVSENNHKSTQLLTPPSVPSSPNGMKPSKGLDETNAPTSEFLEDSNANFEHLIMKSPSTSNPSQSEKEVKNPQSPAIPNSDTGSPPNEPSPLQSSTTPAQHISSQPESNESNGSHLNNDSNNKLQLSPERPSENKSEEASIEGLPSEEIAKSSPAKESKPSPISTTSIITPVEESSNFDGLEGINLPETGVTSTSAYDSNFFNNSNNTSSQQISGPLPSIDPWTNLPFKQPSYDGDLLCNEEFSTRIPSFSTLQNMHHLSPPPSDHRNIRSNAPLDSRQVLMPNHMTPPMSPYSQVYYNSNPSARLCLQPPSTNVRTPTSQYAYMEQKSNILEGSGMMRGSGELFFRPNAVPPIYTESPSSSSLYYAQRYNSPPCLSPALPTNIPSPADSRMCSPDTKQFCGPASTNPNYAAQFYKFQQQLYTPNPGLSELD